MASVGWAVDAVSLPDCQVVGVTEVERDGRRRHDLLPVDRDQHVARRDPSRGGDSAGMHILEHPTLAVVRVSLHQRRGHGDTPGGAWSPLVEEACVARSECAQQSRPRPPRTSRLSRFGRSGLVLRP